MDALPERPALRVRDGFAGPANQAYLRAALRRLGLPAELGATERVLAFAGGEGAALLESDPLAQRGANLPAVDYWGELRRLNRAFLAGAARAAAEAARRGPDYGFAGAADDSHEDFLHRALTEYDLAPPGFECLAAGAPAPAPACGACGEGRRTAEEAVRQFYGGGWEGAGRPFRRMGIPLWQVAGRREVERDVEGTLGRGTREAASQVRRWDMSRARERNGEEYRMHGWTAPRWQKRAPPG